jgi:hypothetical protein
MEIGKKKNVKCYAKHDSRSGLASSCQWILRFQNIPLDNQTWQFRIPLHIRRSIAISDCRRIPCWRQPQSTAIYHMYMGSIMVLYFIYIYICICMYHGESRVSGKNMYTHKRNILTVPRMDTGPPRSTVKRRLHIILRNASLATSFLHNQAAQSGSESFALETLYINRSFRQWFNEPSIR